MVTKQIFGRACCLMALALMTACDGNVIEGKWVEPIPGMENQRQGINLEKDGKASYINMATLQYEKWEKKNGKLILSGKSVGNGQTINFSDTLTINNLAKKN